MKKELNTFKTALMFFTRIPVGNIVYSQEYLSSSSKYLPLIGWIVGGLGGLGFIAFSHVFPMELAVVLMMSIPILVTGAFHEDGFADTCDGFGGGWSKEKILEIMKDSRIGAFGAIGLIMLFLTKYIALTHIPEILLPATFIAGHTVSRYSSVLFIRSHAYVGDQQTGKSKPIGRGIKGSELAFASVTILPPFLFFAEWGFVLIIPAIILIKYAFAQFINKWIGGYTGDCLGALQQITETSFYIFVLLYIRIQNFMI